jgi:hypothetical protein
MGQSILATCTACIFKKEFKFGGNMMDFTTNNPVPAIHKISGKFRNVNYFKTRLKDNYIYYFEEQLKGINTSEYTFQNFDLLLNENGNFCPECKKFTLNFNSLSNTD